MEFWEIAAREAVRHTIGAYTFGGDRGRLNELAAAFAPDGLLKIGDEPPIVGRAAIVDQLGSMLSTEPAPTMMHHHVTGIYFRSVASAVIETSSYFQVITDRGLDHWGRYRDRFVPIGDRWLLASRRVTTDGYAPFSYFTA